MAGKDEATGIALGMMSGTSLDGVDAALLESDGETIGKAGATLFRPYGAQERALLREALAAAVRLTDRTSRPAPLAAAEAVVTAAHAETVAALLSRAGLKARDVRAIGFHGQTVLHAPDRRLTVQIGDGARLAGETGIDVVWDFRAADVAAGGQGAPLVPVYHRALAAGAGLVPPLAIVNIGGVANVTFIGAQDSLVAFDCGPGNALIDDLMRERANAAMDEDGMTAARGRIDEPTLNALLSHPYFRLPPPKSLDRNAFSLAPVAGLSVVDAAATLTAFTAAAIARAGEHLPKPPGVWILSGGGAHNPVMVAEIRARTGVHVETASAFGWSEEFIEAQAFAYLAMRSLRGLPLTFPGTTGVAAPLTGGRLTRAREVQP